MAVRVFKVASLVLAILGVAVLLFVATRSEPPTVDIGNLHGTMNWAYVCVEGTVSRQPTYDPQARNLTLWVSDGSGEIMVLAYRSEAEALLARDLLPVMGDRVTLEGTLRIREDFEYLVLNVPDNLEVRTAEPAEMTIVAVGPRPLYEKVRVRGVIRGDRIPYEGLRILSLRDATGEIDVTIPTGDTALLGDLPALDIGQSVSVEGAVDQYRGTPQISLGRGSDLVVLAEAVPIAPERRMGDLSTADAGSMATVEGILTSLWTFSAGVKGTLDDGTGTIALLLWQDLYENLPDAGSLIPGAILRVEGEIRDYRGEREIVPQLSADVEIVAVAEVTPTLAADEGDLLELAPAPTVLPTPTTFISTGQPAPSPTTTPTSAPVPTSAPTPKASVETRTIGAISRTDQGALLRIAQAGIADTSYFSAGVKYTLTDATGSIILLLWQDLLEDLPDRYHLFPGSQVRVRGRIEEYQGDLEIIPQNASGVRIVDPGERLPIEKRAVSDITPSDEGRVFVIKGSVTRTQVHDWLYLWIHDGTGEILVYVPERVVPYMPAGVTAGTQLRVTGEVDIYKGVLEIIPLAAADIELR